jgi:cob(I)alamin adenosyltransferase
MGTIDELNSWIGYIRSINEDRAVEGKLALLQPRLDILCSDVAAPFEKTDRCKKIPRVLTGWDTDLESEIDEMQKDLSVLTGPIHSVGSGVSAALHLARAVCRRAERWVVLIRDRQGGVNPDAVRFINRLSDYIFILARWVDSRTKKKAGAHKIKNIPRAFLSGMANLALKAEILD